MPGSAPLLARRRERTALAEHHAKINVHLRPLFAEEPRRGERITAEGAGLEPILKTPAPVHAYEAGTWGPPEADRLAVEIGGWHAPETHA